MWVGFETYFEQLETRWQRGNSHDLWNGRTKDKRVRLRVRREDGKRRLTWCRNQVFEDSDGGRASSRERIRPLAFKGSVMRARGEEWGAVGVRALSFPPVRKCTYGWGTRHVTEDRQRVLEEQLDEGEAFDAEVGMEDGGVGGEGTAAVVEEAEADEIVAGYDKFGFGGGGVAGVADADDAAVAA